MRLRYLLSNGEKLSYYNENIGVFDTNSYVCSQMLHYLVNGVMQANIG